MCDLLCQQAFIAKASIHKHNTGVKKLTRQAFKELTKFVEDTKDDVEKEKLELEQKLLQHLIEEKQLDITDGSYNYNMTLTQIMNLIQQYSYLEGTELYDFITAAFGKVSEGYQTVST